MAVTKAQKARNRKILWYIILIAGLLFQSYLQRHQED